MQRPADRVVVVTEEGEFDAFQQIEIVTDLFDVSTATFEIGDDDAWSELERIVRPGRGMRIYLNDLLQMTGRAEVNEVPTTADGGTIIQLVCRTRMADARVASADPRIRFRDASIRDFLIALYAPHGYTAGDFSFAPAADRKLVTGKAIGAEDPVDLEPLKPDAMKVAPPETVFEAAQKHLKRHHLMHWDGADGRILVGRPDDEQPPSARLICRRAGAGNNVISIRRVRDWSDVPSETWVYGATAGRDVLKAALRGVAVDLDLAAAAAASGDFFRPVLLPSEGAKSQAQVDAQAAREMAARRQRKDAWDVELDAWTYWDGSTNTPYAVNTMVEVDFETTDANAAGRYLVTRVARRLSAEGGASATIALIAPGILAL